MFSFMDFSKKKKKESKVTRNCTVWHSSTRGIFQTGFLYSIRVRLMSSRKGRGVNFCMHHRRRAGTYHEKFIDLLAKISL
jgi:hypothetical protein